MALSDTVRDLFYKYFGYAKNIDTNISNKVDDIFHETIPGAGSYLENRLRLRRDRWSSYREYTEMDRGIIHSALTLFAEDAVSIDIQRNKSVWVETDNPTIEKILNKLTEVLSIPENLPAIARGLAKYGADYEQLFMEEGRGIISWKYCPPDVITRVEDHYGRLLGFSPGILEQYSYDLERHKLPEVMSKPFDFVHFRTVSYDRGMIHGSSVIEGARDYFKPFEMSLHNMIMYRLKNGPDRIVWNIDVGSQSPDEQMRTVEMWRRYLKKQQYRAGDKYKNQYDPYSADDDIFFPKPTNSTSSVERLNGSSNFSDIGDVELFLNLLFSTLRIPKAYMGFEGDVNCCWENTPIPCLDGIDRTLGEIVKTYESTGELPYVYSMSPKGKVSVGKVTWAGITKRDVEVLDVWLDDGTCIKCTPEHLWLTVSGEYKRADELNVNDQIMPLVVYKDEKGYERFRHNVELTSGKHWQHTHRMVANYDPIKLLQEYDIQKSGSVAVIHYKDLNKDNNHPHNIQIKVCDDYIGNVCNQCEEVSKPFTAKLIIKVERATERVDTGDITVEKCHNFAIRCNDGSGVFVHNSKATLVNEDLRYARTIFNLQSALIQGLNRLGHIHLMLLGHNPRDEKNKFTFALPISTYLLELAKSELWQVRIEMASRLVDISDRMEPVDKGAFAKYIFMEFLRLPKSVISQLFISKQEYDQIKQATYGIGGDMEQGEEGYGDEEGEVANDGEEEPEQEQEEPKQPMNDSVTDNVKNLDKVLKLLKEHKKIYTPGHLLEERETMEPIPHGSLPSKEIAYSSYGDVRDMIEKLSCTNNKK